MQSMSTKRTPRKYVRIPVEIYWVFEAVASDSQFPAPVLIRQVLADGLVSAGVLEPGLDVTPKRRDATEPSKQDEGTVMFAIPIEIHGGLAMLAKRRMTSIATEARLILVAYLEGEGLWPIEEE